MLKELDNSNISKHLGQTSQYKSTYDTSLLVREPRASNRTHLNIDDDTPPFKGYDIWNAYEFSCLCVSGTPITGVAKIVYPATNKYIVESKSLKLYFNSFNMEKYEGSVEEVISKVEAIMQKDLSDLLETEVSVSIVPSGNEQPPYIPCFYQYNANYVTLEDIIDVSTLECSIYNETPALLTGQWIVNELPSKEVYYHSCLLKSNCRVTSQPDWGDVYIYYKGKCELLPESLLKYIVSFRNECHFHEEICETIYKRIWDSFEPEELAVTCLYARRGGVDINPTRVSDDRLLDPCLVDNTIPHVKTLRQ
jgi:7-cyano-7-deazaguanine reductase